MPLEETCISGILGCGLGLKDGSCQGHVGMEGGGGLTESCRSCRVFIINFVVTVPILNFFLSFSIYCQTFLRVLSADEITVGQVADKDRFLWAVA